MAAAAALGLAIAGAVVSMCFGQNLKDMEPTVLLLAAWLILMIFVAVVAMALRVSAIVRARPPDRGQRDTQVIESARLPGFKTRAPSRAITTRGRRTELLVLGPDRLECAVEGHVVADLEPACQ